MCSVYAVDDTSKHVKLQSRLPFSDSLFAGRRRYYFRDWRPHMETGVSSFVDSPAAEWKNVEPSKRPKSASGKARRVLEGLFRKAAKLSPTSRRRSMLNESSADFSPYTEQLLTDEGLERILRYLHPNDRIHTASLVCKRWHRLVYSENVWREVRIWKINPAMEMYVRIFLRKVSQSLEKLCIGTVREPLSLLNVLPDKLPNVKYFEVGSSEMDNGLVSDVDMFGLLGACMPQLQTLIISRLFSRHCCSFIEFASPQSLGTLHSWALSADVFDLESLLDQRPDIEQLKVDCRAMAIRCHEQEVSPRAASLTKLSLFCWGQQFVDLSTVAQQLRLLTFLELRAYGRLTDICILRSLRSLEHLHLYLSEVDDNDCQYLFKRSERESSFPHGLRHLSLSPQIELSDTTIMQICSSCPELRSLSVGYEEREPSTFVGIIRSLKMLQFLAVGACENLNVLLDELSRAPCELRCLRIAVIGLDVVRLVGCVAEREVALLASTNVLGQKVEQLLRTKPRTAVRVGEQFVTYRYRKDDVHLRKETLQEHNTRVDCTLEREPGYCCIEY